jgi:predicted Zn-dependent protease
MVGKERIWGIAEAVLAQSRADQTEICVMVDDQWLTRFSDNHIHQNVNEADHRIAVRTVLGQKAGTASTNSLDTPSVLDAVLRALAQTRLLPDDPEFAGLPATGRAPEIDAFDQATADMSSEDRADAVSGIVGAAKQKGLTAYGFYSTSIAEIAIANSLGTRAYHAGTEADCMAIVTGRDSSGYARFLSRRADGIDTASIAATAIAKCRDAANPRPLVPGEYEVVLEEDAVSDLVSSIGMGFDASAVREGRSPFSAKVGQKVAGSNVTVRDDGSSLDGLPLPFDFEGRPRKQLVLVDHGVITGLVYDSKTAAKEGKEPTGHALPGFARGMGLRALPIHVFVEPGTATLKDMIESTKKGILVTRFWYNRTIHPLKTIITGMTRDGAFYVENGEIKYPILNLRYTQSVLEALNNVEMLGRVPKLRSMYFGALSVPAMKISRFTFTGTTEH